MKIEPNESDFQIDRYRLDDEWVKQPDLFRRYAEALADAKREYEEAKNDANLVRAEIELAMRKEPEKYDLPKITEGMIKAALDAADEMKEVEQKTIDARHKVGVLEAAVTALDHRKRALSDLVSLHLADYFSKPVAREDGRERMEEAGKQRVRKSQRRRNDDDD